MQKCLQHLPITKPLRCRSSLLAHLGWTQKDAGHGRHARPLPAHPHVGSKPFLLGTPLASPEPTCSPSVLVERLLLFSFQNLESCYARHLLWLHFFTPSPWAEDHHCNGGTSSSCSFHMWNCLPFMLRLSRRTAAEECYRGCLVWICLNRPQPDPFPASQLS